MPEPIALDREKKTKTKKTHLSSKLEKTVFVLTFLSISMISFSFTARKASWSMLTWAEKDITEIISLPERIELLKFC